MAAFVTEEEIIKVEFMTKRSIMKSRFKTENYKGRWFVLTPNALSYHEGSSDNGRHGKAKGHIYLKNVKAVKSVDGRYLQNKPNAFQVTYIEDASGDPYTLYIIAVTDSQRDDWINLVTSASLRCGAEFFTKYHPGTYNKKAGHWMCCEDINRWSEGCEDFTCPQAQSQSDLHKRVASSFMNRPLPDEPGKKKPPEPAPRPDLHGGSRLLPQPPGHVSVLPPVPPAKPSKKPPPPVDPVLQKVLALYDYEKAEEHDLELIKGEEYELVLESSNVWWKARNRNGSEGFIPANYVQKLSDPGLHSFDWYYPSTNRTQSEEILKKEGKEGCFLVRDSSTRGMYTLSIFAKESGEGIVKHYHIKKNYDDKFFLTEKHAFEEIPELIHYHKHNSAGLIVRLRSCPSDQRSSQPATPGFGYDQYDVDVKDLEFHEDLGSGQFGTVKKAIWQRGNRKKTVAVKMMKEDTMSEQDFIDEAKTMQQLQNEHLVQLYGVSTTKPIMIVTEYMKNGALLSYLRRHKISLTNKPTQLLEMCVQVCRAMEYLESMKFIHRDLAARNCLVGDNVEVKVGDFGLARFVLDDEYTSSHGTKFPIRWAPPEVLQYTKFSTKSDVWSFGILMWEIYTGGDLPYGRVKNQQVIEMVCHQRRRLDQPRAMMEHVYKAMLSCWEENPTRRPEFQELANTLVGIQESLSDYVD